VTQRAHVVAFVSMLEDADLTVFVSVSPNNTAPPYVVVHPAMPQPTGQTLCGTSSRRSHDLQTTSVGVTTEQAQAVAEDVSDAVLEKRPVIVGRECGPVSKEYTQTARRDDDVDPPVFYAVDGWSFTSN
jgi:hypothetical protein